MSSGDELSPPGRSKGDFVHALAKAGIASIPLVGGAGSELFQIVLAAPLEKRRNEWMENVGQAILDLQARAKLSQEELRANDAFVDTALQATQIAMRNSQKEKRDALRNAVINSALPSAPEQALQQFFLRMIDELTVWHLRLLKLFNQPAGWFEEYHRPWPPAGSLSGIFEGAFPVLRGRRDEYDQYWRDLFLRGLVTTEHLHVMMTGGGLTHSRTTTIGQKFLSFISTSPSE